jgi:flagellar assembly protein FliH
MFCVLQQQRRRAEGSFQGDEIDDCVREQRESVKPMPVKIEAEILTMEYPLLGGAPAAVTEPPPAADLARRVRELEAEQEEKERQWGRKLESARQEAVELGRRMAGGEQAAWRQQAATALTTALDGFRARTDEYLARVEHEVVQLALAVAERILHRESLLDPLLLSGAVRVALGQLAESTKARLRVPAGQREMWAEQVRLMPGLPLRPEVCADPEMEGSDAVMETDVGTIDLGVRSQLKEIERGFFDLLEVRREPAGGAGRSDTGGKRG